mgnify:CR=1 FL=1
MEEKVVKMYEEGCTMKDIAKEYGCERHTISRILHKHGVSTSRHELLVGKTYQNKYGDKYKVLKDLVENGVGKCLVEFINTGYKTIQSSADVKRGFVKDYYKKTIYGVACKGHVVCRKKSFERLCFHRWTAMVARCYNIKSSSYKVYGQKGVRISERWLNFENFFEDLEKIPGYNKQKYINHEIELDKDKKGNGLIYSLETCQFIPVLENRRHQKIKPFKAISPESIVYYYNTQAECARHLGLIPRSIGKCLHKQLKHHHNYSFEYLEPQETIPSGSNQ